MSEAVRQNWSSRALERQISTLYYERLLASQDKAAVAAEASALLAPLSQTPREFVRDPVQLEFLGLPGTGRLLESDLEQGLMDKLQAFFWGRVSTVGSLANVEPYVPTDCDPPMLAFGIVEAPVSI